MIAETFWGHLHRVGTGHLLADHETNRKEGTVPVAGDCPHLSHQVFETRIANQSAFVVKLIPDLGELAGNVGVRGRKSADAREGCGSLFPAVLASEPAGRLIAEPHGAEEQSGGETLHDKGNDVLGVASDVCVGAVVDPERQHDTGGDEELVDTSQTTADGTRSVLGNCLLSASALIERVISILTVQRRNHGSSTDTETGNETTNEDSGNVTHGGCLHDSTDDGEDSCKDQVVAATDLVSNDTGAESTDETTTLQGGNDVCLEIGLGNRVIIQCGEAVGTTDCVSSSLSIDTSKVSLLTL